MPDAANAHVLARRTSTIEFFKADPAQGFMWGKDPAEALQFARWVDATRVASMVADDCYAVPFGDGSLEGLSAALDSANIVVDALACDAAGGKL